MTDSMEKAEVSIPVTNMDDEGIAASTASSQSVDQEPQQQQYQFSSPTNIGLMVDDSQAAHQGYSPALQLESSLLNESTIDSFVQPGDGLKAALPQLESTRISSTYPPADFESEQDISKVQSEPGDSDNPFNAGFVKEDQNSGLDSGVIESILATDPKQETSLESSVFEPETSQQLEMSENHKEEGSSEEKVEQNGIEAIEEINANMHEKDTVEDAKESANDSHQTDNSVEMAEEAVEVVNGTEVSSEKIVEDEVEILPTKASVETTPVVIEPVPEVTVEGMMEITSVAKNEDAQTNSDPVIETPQETAPEIVLEPSLENPVIMTSENLVAEVPVETAPETVPEPAIQASVESVPEPVVGTTVETRPEALPEQSVEVSAESAKEIVLEPVAETSPVASSETLPEQSVEASAESAKEIILEPVAEASLVASSETLPEHSIEASVESAVEIILEAPLEAPVNTVVEKDVEVSTESNEGALPEDSIEVEAIQAVKVLQVEADKNMSRVESDGSILEKLTNESTCSDPEVEQLLKLPETVTEFVSKDGVKVYLVGTAHFSLESQEDVAKTILVTRPRVVMVELCVSRLNILRFDEQTILEEAQNLNMTKIRSTLKQYGAVQGALYLLFLSTSAHLTRQLGMAPGGEFRRAYNEARNVLGCRIHLGDRPIHITLHRALAALSMWQKAKLVWHLLLNRSSISPEEVERCKKKDLLEEMLEEMTGEFPALSRVFVQERDLCLAHSLQLAASDAAAEAKANNFTEAPAVVGVVGIGHVAGIVNYFGTVTEADVKNVMKIPPRTRASRLLVTAVKISLVGLVAYGCYKASPKLQTTLLSIRHAVFSR